jgi:antitoxin YefM
MKKRFGHSMDIYTTSQARNNLFAIMEHVVKSNEPTYIVGKKNKAVLISEKDYQALMETLYLISIPGMNESILQASKEPLEAFSESIDWENV